MGAGDGFDLFIAGCELGTTGRAIGVDLTPEVVGKACRRLASTRLFLGLTPLGKCAKLPIV